MVALHRRETAVENGDAGAGFESWEIAGEKEGHPERGDFTREKRP